MKKVLQKLRPRKPTKKFFITLILFLILVPSFFLLYAQFFKNTAEAAPWSSNHPGWAKRKALTLTNNSAVTLSTNTPYQITIDTRTNTPQTAGDFQTDCDDLRVVYQPDSSTFTELARAYHIAQGATTCTDSGATIVNFPLQANISSGSSSTSYYLYYANPTAGAPSATQLSSYNFGSKTATFVAPMNGSVTALAAGSGTGSTAGAIRYSGNRGSAINFNGLLTTSKDYISVADAATLDNASQMTFEWWMKPTIVDTNNRGILCKRVGGSNQDSYCFFLNTVSGSMTARIDGTATETTLPGGTLVQNNWYHIAVVFDGTLTSTSRVKIYVNGVLTATGTESSSSIPNNASDLVIGGFESATANGISGFMDEVRVSNNVRYSSNFTPQTTPFIRDSNTMLLLHLDENGNDPRNTGKAIDDSGNANHGTLTNSPKYISNTLGFDNSNAATVSHTGNLPIQSYAGHQGVLLESGITNLITNPSFEHSTYDTNWVEDSGADAADNITPSVNTTAPYYKFGTQSVQIIADADAISTTSNMYTIPIDPNSAVNHKLSFYVYDATSGNVGGTVSSSIVKPVWEGVSQNSGTYVNMGGGWWRVYYSASATDNLNQYGVEVQAGKTVYIDGFQLQTFLIDSYADGSMGSSYAWTGTAHNSTSTRTRTDLTYSDDSNISPNAGTLSFWFYQPLSRLQSGGTDIFDWRRTGFFDRLEVGIAASGGLSVAFTKSDNTTMSCGTGVGASNGEWHHFTLTWRANSAGNDGCQLYADGAASGTGASGQSITFGPTDLFGFRNNGNNGIPDAIVSDVRIYNDRLTATEVSELYNSTLGTYSATTQEKDTANLYWKFDEGQGSTAGNSGYVGSLLAGTLNNTPTWQTENMCVLGKCLLFDGTNDESVSKIDQDNLDFGAADNFSVGAWVKRNGSSSAINYIISKADATTGGYKLWMDADGDLCFGIDDDSSWGPDISACSDANGDFDDNRWHYVVGVRDQNTTDKIYVYVDGNEMSGGGTADSTTTTLANTNAFYVGVDRDGTSNEWLGFIDEVKLFPFALSSDQVKIQYNLGGANVLGANTQNMDGALSDGLVGYWKMDESSWTNNCSTGSVLDSSGNSYNGKSCPNSTGPTGGANGKFGNGGSFDGSNDYVQIDSAPALNITTALTVCSWINTADASATYGIFQRTRDPGGSIHTGYQLYTQSSTYKFLVQRSDDGNPQVLTSTSAVTTGWNHICGSFLQSGTLSRSSIYINGRLDVQSDASGFSIIANTGETYIGSFSGTGNFSGRLDETRVYNRALSSQEISQLYNWTPPPVGYWKFDDKTGTTPVDSSGSGYNGSFTNTPTWVQGKYGGGINFSGGVGDVQQLVTMGNQSLLNGREGFTASAWIYRKGNSLTTDGVAGNIMNKNTWYLDVRDSDQSPASNVRFVISGVSDTSLDSGTAITNNTWTYVTAVYDGVRKYIYFNGVLVASEATTGTPSTDSSSFQVGKGVTSGASQNNFNGIIDEARFYNYTRTQAQIIEDMNGSHPAPGSPVGTPIGHWKFDEGAENMCSGGTNDVCNNGSAGNTYDGTSTATRTNAGKFNRALDFDGSDDVVTITNNTAIDMDGNLANFTLSTWVNADSDGEADTGQIVSKGASTYLRVDSQDGSNNLDIECNLDRATTDTNVNVADAFTTTTWNYVSCSWDGTTLTVYINGQSRGSSTSGSGAISSDSNNLLIGGGTSNNFDGKIDEFKVYSQVLTADQIKLDMNRGAAQVMGAVSASSNTQPNAASNEYCPPNSSASVCTGPVGEWKLDESAIGTRNDTSGNGSNMTDNNSSITAVNGKFNKAALFNGSNTGLFVNDNTFVSQASSFTVSAWVKLNSTANGQTIIGKYTNVDGTREYMLDYGVFASSNRFGFSTFGSGGTNAARVTVSANNFGAPSANVWYYVVGWYDASTGNNYISVNGGLPNSTGSNGVGDLGSQFRIGSWGSGSGSSIFIGAIDTVRLYNYARTQAQISWEYNKGGPIAHWKMDECQGTTLNDMSGNSFSGTLTNATAGTCSTSGAWFNGATGKRNYSVDLDGSDDYIQISDNASLRFDDAAGDFSLFAWIKRESNGEMNIISKEDADNDGYRLQFTSGNVVRCSVDAIDIDSTLTITDTNWHFVGCTIDRDGNGQIYIDGKANGTATAISSEVMANTSNIRLGTRSYTSTNYLDGLLDDTRIYNYALTATQIKTLYNEGAYRTGPSTGAP